MNFIIYSVPPLLAGLGRGGYRLLMALGLVLLLSGAALFILGLRGLLKKSGAGQCKKRGNVDIYVSSALGDRQIQQDACFRPAELSEEQIASRGLLGLVCDGMGGMEGGEAASRLCAERVSEGFYAPGGTEEPCRRLEELIHAADRELALLADPDGRLLNCGTTIVAAVYREGRLCWASAGDSRIYLIRNGAIEQLTRDHNFRMTLEELARRGQLKAEDVENNPQKNALISFVGKGRELLVDTGRLDFNSAAGDMLILCSDGLYKALSDREILALALSGEDSAALPERLTKAALSKRNIRHDNITVMIIN